MGTKPGPDKVTTQNTQLPAHILQAQQQLIGSANNITSPFLQQSPNFGVMGLTPNQMLANDLAFQSAQHAFTTPQLSPFEVMSIGGNGPALAGTPMATAQQAQAAQAQAAQLNPNDIAPFMNPYIDTALTPALDRLRQQQAETQAGIGANAAAANMFGGSREAVQRMLADRNYKDTLANTAGSMLHQGWNQASGLAQGNVANQQQTNLANAQMQNAINSLNAQLGTNVSTSNAGMGLQAALANALAQNNWGQNQAQNFLQAAGMQGNLNTQNLQNQQSAIQLLNNLGLQQQQTGQNAISYPMTVLNALSQAIGNLQGGGTQTTTTPTFTNPVGDIAGGALAMLGLPGTSFGGTLLSKIFSDKNDKTDIKKLGKDPETGVDMYAYRYKGDPKSYPKVVGPMAQDLEKVLPGITKLIGGHMVVSPG